MNDDVEGLIAAIRDRPKDDAPRLILADLFEEPGREKEAELLRLDVELHRMGGMTVKNYKRRHEISMIFFRARRFRFSFPFPSMCQSWINKHFFPWTEDSEGSGLRAAHSRTVGQGSTRDPPTR